MRYNQRPPQVDAMRFIPDDPAADVDAINAWLVGLQADVDPVYAATFRAPTPDDDEFFADWDPKPWVLAQAEPSMGETPQRRPVWPGNWILLLPNPSESMAWVMEDTAFNATYAPA